MCALGDRGPAAFETQFPVRDFEAPHPLKGFQRSAMLSKSVERDAKKKQRAWILWVCLYRTVEVFCRRNEFATVELHDPKGYQVIGCFGCVGVLRR